MGRTAARGRIFPQFFSSDHRFGRLSLKAVSLFPLMWTNSDDQGRIGILDLEEIKYSCCPNIDHITKADIPDILDELEKNNLILLYQASKYTVVQMIDWWRPHEKMQWPQPSEYPPPKGWKDHMRYKQDAKTVITVNWPVSPENSADGSGENSGENTLIAQVGANKSSGENPADNSGENSGERSGEDTEETPLTTPFFKEEEEEGKGRGRGRGISPENSADEPDSTSVSDEENPSPSSTVSPEKIMERLTKCFRIEWGRVPAENPDEVIPREPDARENAQLRDLAQELSNAGGCPLDYIDQAFQEAAGHQKMYISYVRKILLDWLGIEDKKK